MSTVTVFVMTKNEEAIIRQCLEKLQWADELLVVDSHSTDRTREIAGEMGAKVLTRDFTNFSDQANYGLSMAEGDWVIQIDADEIMPPELRDSIRKTVADNPKEEIFAVRRDSVVFGRRLKSTAWSNEWVPRLFRKGAVTFVGAVHQDPQIAGRPVGRLEGTLLHYTYRSTEQYFAKFQVYSTLWAKKARENGRRTSLTLAGASSLWRVFHDYFIRGGIRDGRIGMVLSLLAGMHTFIRHIKLWGLQNVEEFAKIETGGNGADQGGT